MGRDEDALYIVPTIISAALSILEVAKEAFSRSLIGLDKKCPSSVYHRGAFSSPILRYRIGGEMQKDTNKCTELPEPTRIA